MFRTREHNIAHVISVPQLLGGEGVNMGDRGAPQGAADKLYVCPLDIGDNKDAHLGQKVQAQLVVGITENGLLD